MRINALSKCLGAVAIAATAAAGQVYEGPVPAVQQMQNVQRAEGWVPAGPADFVPVPFIRRGADVRMMLPEESALMQPAGEGHFTNLRTSLAGGQGGGGDGSRYIDQPVSCDDGFYSNNNSNNSPYLTFDDFVADGSPLQNVRFYGGTTDNFFGDIDTIGIEIWTITSGGDCGWTYNGFVGAQTFTLAELNPTYVCDAVGIFPSYEMLATFASPIALNAGQNYMITIYATLNNPDGVGQYFWNMSTVNNYNPSSSWNRTDGSFARCGPDAAFSTNVDLGFDCQPNDCSTAVYFSNYPQNSNSPYLSLDDFVATEDGDLRHLSFSGGAWDISTASPTNLGNQAGFYIELYRAEENSGYPCNNYVSSFLGAYQVSMADAHPKFQCVDIHGISEYEFNIAIPAGHYPLVAGEHYTLGVYGISNDINDPRVFCWGTTDAIYGFNSWSFDLDNALQSCHSADNAFCVNPQPPCLGDFNGDGTVNTIDVLGFLNAWAAGELSADCNGDGAVNTIDVLCFLNRWAAGC